MTMSQLVGVGRGSESRKIHVLSAVYESALFSKDVTVDSLRRIIVRPLKAFPSLPHSITESSRAS